MLRATQTGKPDRGTNRVVDFAGTDGAAAGHEHRWTTAHPGDSSRLTFRMRERSSALLVKGMLQLEGGGEETRYRLCRIQPLLSSQSKRWG